MINHYSPIIRFEHPDPPPFWGQRCEEKAKMFHSSAWHQVLQRGFGANCFYIWKQAEDTAFAINVFKAGPFRIGYLGFPTGGTVKGELTLKHLEALRSLRLRVDLLRIPVSAFGPQFTSNLHSTAVPETAIVDLANWSLARLPKLRRDLSKARRASFDIHDIESNNEGSVLYELYRNTILAHGGSLRYTPAYFQALLELAENQESIRCIGAYQERSLCGFIVVVLDGTTAYYLHGAAKEVCKKAGVSDLLIYKALEWAQSQAMECFNLMASPASQPGLIRYKEKFGGVTRQHHTYELPLTILRFRFFNLVLWVRRKYCSIKSSYS